MLERGIVPDIVTYNSLIDGYCLRGEMSKAKSVYDSMASRRLDPDIFTYNSLVNRYCKTLMIDEVMHLFHKITKRGLKPDVVTYNTMIQGLFQIGSCGDAHKLFDEMRAKGPKPDEYGASKCGKLDIARFLFQDLCNKCLHPDVLTYAVMISGLCREGYLKNKHYDDVEMLLGKMDGIGYSLDVSTLSLLIDSIVVGSLDVGVIPTLISKLVPNEWMDSSTEGTISLVNGYCKNLMIDEAMHLFHGITNKGLKPDVVTYSTIIQGLFRVGRCEDAHKLFDVMRAKGLKPNECTYRIIEKALSLFHLMGDGKLNSDINVYNIIINGDGKCGKHDIARVLFQDLTNKGLHPDVHTYSVMISGLCREGLVRDAKQLFLQMAESGCLPDNVTYRLLLQGFIRNQYYDDVEMLLHEMDGRGFSLDASTLSLLLDQTAASSLDTTLLELIGNLVPKE
ncbi:putative tetratricopeptide-like helical domain superfamily protein [Tanacetum coccineum]